MSQPRPFNDYNENRVLSKNVDYFMGVARSLASKPSIDTRDVDLLAQILDGNPAIKDHPVLREIALPFAAGTATNLLTTQGMKSLHRELQALCGISNSGLPGGSISILFDENPPVIVFHGRRFCFTGTFKYGTRLRCAEAVEALGGIVVDRVTIDTDYLVVGSQVTETWRHHTFGHKVTQAKEWRDKNASDIEIVSEEHWDQCLGLAAPTKPSRPTHTQGSSSGAPNPSASKSSSGAHAGSESCPRPGGASSWPNGGPTRQSSFRDSIVAATRPYILSAIVLTVVFAIGWAAAG